MNTSSGWRERASNVQQFLGVPKKSEVGSSRKTTVAKHGVGGQLWIVARPCVPKCEQTTVRTTSVSRLPPRPLSGGRLVFGILLEQGKKPRTTTENYCTMSTCAALRADVCGHQPAYDKNLPSGVGAFGDRGGLQFRRDTRFLSCTRPSDEASAASMLVNAM